MKPDLYTKAVLTVIALALFANVVASFLNPRHVAAQSGLTCTGQLQAGPHGALDPNVGGYSVKVTCR
jgi:hypothetical protein